MHNFKPGDLIKDKETGEFGLVIRTNELEIIVGWQDVECNGWDTYPDDVDFVCHIPAARILDDRQEAEWRDSSKAMIERDKEMIRLMKEMTEKVKYDG
jgi:hypothetical protein